MILAGVGEAANASLINPFIVLFLFSIIDYSGSGGDVANALLLNLFLFLFLISFIGGVTNAPHLIS